MGARFKTLICPQAVLESYIFRRAGAERLYVQARRNVRAISFRLMDDRDAL
jgi:hypothetical protein